MVTAQERVAKFRDLFMQGGDREGSPEQQQILAMITESVRHPADHSRVPVATSKLDKALRTPVCLHQSVRLSDNSLLLLTQARSKQSKG